MNKEQQRQLARHLRDLAYEGRGDRPTIEDVRTVVESRLACVSDQELARLDAIARQKETKRIARADRHILLSIVGSRALDKAIEAAPDGHRPAPTDEVLEAAARIETTPDQPAAEDEAMLASWATHGGGALDGKMDNYVAEQRGLPAGFDLKDFVKRVHDRLTQLGGDVNAPFVGVVAGRLMLDGNTEHQRSDFRWAVKRAYDEGVRETRGLANKVYYTNVVEDLKALRPRQKIRYQELAAVADHVIAAGDDWRIDQDYERRSQVQVGILKYADGTADTGFAPLDLPSIVSEDAANQEIEPQNVRAVGMIAAAAEIEQTGAFDVVDRMLELFLQGMLPVRDDSGGRALDRYFWQSEERLDASARSRQYARVVGAGTDAGTDVQPNASFEQLLMRFVSNLVRYDGNLQVSNVVTLNRGERPGSSEMVRKAAQDLASNASLYGWGFSIFAARRLSRHIDMVFDVLGQETLQRAYGVTGPWQLVERVSAVEFSTTPAIVRHRTRAQATKDLLDLLAKYATDLSKSGAVRRFLPGVIDFTPGHTDRPVVNIDDYHKMVSAANNILAVGAVTEEDITNYSRPVANVPMGSIPTVGGDSAGNGAGIDQLRQLISQGQTPTLDQLQRLLPINNPVG